MFLLILILKGEEGRKRIKKKNQGEWETSISCFLYMSPTRDRTGNLGMYPQSFSVWAEAPTKSPSQSHNAFL